MFFCCYFGLRILESGEHTLSLLFEEITVETTFDPNIGILEGKELNSIHNVD